MFVMVDTEATGFDPCNIIEIAFYNTAGKSFKSYVKPTIPIAPAATIIHGITNDEASKFPEKSEVESKLIEYLDSLPDGVIFCGYNVDFDIQCIAKDFNISLNHHLDIARFVKKYMSLSLLGGYKLDAVYYYLFPDRLQKLLDDRRSHDAMTDCILAQHIFDKLVEVAVGRGDIPNNYTDTDITQFVDLPILIDKWPFGKYKNKSLTIDPKYAEWYCKLPDADRDISYSIKTLLHKP